MAKYRDGTVEETSDILATEWVQRYFEIQVKPNQKPNVAKGVQAHINKYIMPPLEDRQLRAVTAFDLQEIMNSTAGMSKTLVSIVKQIL